MSTCISEPTTDGFTGRLCELRTVVDQGLRRFSSRSDGCPEHLHEAIQYALLSPGKRFRPVLTLLATEACGGAVDSALPAACAVEMVHSYSLVHDDLPALDNDDLRRGRPTCHKQFGEDIAILAGDALLTLAFECLTNHIHPAELAGECCRLLSAAAGSGRLIGGQADDVAPERVTRSLDQLQQIHARKTGALILVAIELGATVSRADRRSSSALAEYGSKLGLAFQIADDLLDVLGESEKEGKRLRKDAEKNKLTFPGLLGIETSFEWLERTVEEACECLNPLGTGGDHLCRVACALLGRFQR